MKLKYCLIFLVCLWGHFLFAQTVKEYRVGIELNFLTKTISGTTEILFPEKIKGRLSFPLYGIEIDEVRMKGKKIKFAQNNEKLDFTISEKDQGHSIKIKYHGQPNRGLTWGDDFVYTQYEPCSWMICFEAPGIRAPIVLTIKFPDEMKATATGELTSQKQNKQAKTITQKWSEPRGYASYLYGFAVGKFAQVIEDHQTFKLEYLGFKQTEVELQKKFKDTAGVVQFFESKAGVRLPLKKYVQVLVPGEEAQEKQGFSILGMDYIDPILVDPQEDWAIVHELAHQWWGNLITCKSWQHFWLNEGLVVFMTAAYKQQHWGQASYDREMELAQKRYQKAKDSKFDVPLTFSGEYPSLGIKRAIVYSKGALFLDALRKEIGEEAFWGGIKLYTMNNQLGSVESGDFQKALETTSKKNLEPIFKKWVY